MRKFLLILLNVLCLSMAFSQSIIPTIRTYKKGGFKDTFRLTNEYVDFYDKKTCLDTARTEYDQRIMPSTTNEVESKFQSFSRKFDDKKRVSEINRTFYINRIDKSNGKTLFTNSKIDKDKIFYTPSNIKYDSIANEVFDTVAQKWVFAKYFLRKKGGFGNDTIRSGSNTSVIDNKGRFILGYTQSNGKTVDSTYYKYDNLDRFVSYELFLTNPINDKFGLLTSFTIKYDGNKIMQKLGYSIDFNNFDTIRNYTNYTYTNDILDLEESYKEVKSKSGSVNYSERTRSRYTKYNVAKKCLEKINEYGSTTGTTWNLIGINKMTYYQDTLIKIDSLFGYLNNQLSGEDAITKFEYDSCTPITSSTSNINQGIDFTLAPNPSTGLFNLSLSEEAMQSGASVSVYNIQGGEVFRTKLTSESTAIDLSNLSKGFYLVKVADKTHSSVKKLVLN
jgi:Secretion system C-terminal sorting domain